MTKVVQKIQKKILTRKLEKKVYIPLAITSHVPNHIFQTEEFQNFHFLENSHFQKKKKKNYFTHAFLIFHNKFEGHYSSHKKILKFYIYFMFKMLILILFIFLN